MRKTERREQILREIGIHAHVRISDLAARFGVSTETVRRDVEELSGEGLISRAYGGASTPMGSQASFGERNLAQVDERIRIGQRAAELVQRNDVLMIDAGSTTLQLAAALAATAQALTVITNSLAIASTLGHNDGIDVIMCPGDYLAREAGVYGAETIDFLSRYNANRAFIGASGVSTDGIFDANRSAVAVKRAIIGRAKDSYLLVDHTKFGVELIATVASIDSIVGIVADEPPLPDLKQKLTELNVAIYIA